MTTAEVFAKDLATMNAKLVQLGALVTYSDGFVGIDSSKAPAALLSAYAGLAQFGCANGLI